MLEKLYTVVSDKTIARCSETGAEMFWCGSYLKPNAKTHEYRVWYPSLREENYQGNWFSPDWFEFRAANTDDAIERANKKLMKHYQQQLERLTAWRLRIFDLSDQQGEKSRYYGLGLDVDEHARYWALEADALFATQAHPDGVREAGA